MQKVFSNDMVAHVWANGNQTEGRSHNGQFYFVGRTLYSYGPHYVAGLRLEMPSGTWAALIATGEYSPTTGRHVSYARRAVSEEWAVCESLTMWADILRGVRGNKRERMERADYVPERMETVFPGLKAATLILEYCGFDNPERRANAIKARIERAEKTRAEREAKREREGHERDAKEIAEKPRGELAALYFGYDDSDIADMKELSTRLLRAQQAAKAKGWTRIFKAVQSERKMVRDGIAKAEKGKARARFRRERRGIIRRFRDMLSSYSANLPLSSLGARIAHVSRFADNAYAVAAMPGVGSDAARLARAARDEQTRLEGMARAERIERERETRETWLAGGGPRYVRFDSVHDGAALRAVGVVRDDSGAIVGGTLETSHGAHVPLVHAVRIFRLVRLVRERGETVVPDASAARVGHFRVDRIEPDGSFRAGCHMIKWGEIERIARELNLYP